jgi:D-tyrosyl-tRNA(Tyr) deacylase
MIALIQRVTRASVTIAGRQTARIDTGLVALVAAEPDDTAARAERLAQRVVSYRLFADAKGRMNLSAQAADKAVLAVPQFTLTADTRRGNRPGFSTACPPERAEPLFATFVAALQAQHAPIATGRFGADMQIELVNDGPVTFWLSA